MKKGIMICILIAIMMFSMVGCKNASAATVDETSATTEPVFNLNEDLCFGEGKGTFSKATFGRQYIVYRFPEPNEDIAVYKIGANRYVLGENSEKKTGAIFASIYVENHEFIAISNDYMLFEGQYGLLAVSINGTAQEQYGLNIYQEYGYEDLTYEEKISFVYSVGHTKETNRFQTTP